MIVVATSALMAILQNEPDGTFAENALLKAERIVISAGTLFEALVVARRRGVGTSMTALIGGLGIEVVPLSHDGAEQAANAYDGWGKGIHPAGLKMADCFAYALAKSSACPLLFVGQDFARTDIESALN